MSIVMRILGYIQDKIKQYEANRAIKVQEQLVLPKYLALQDIINKIDLLNLVCNEMLLSDIKYDDKYKIWVVINDLIGLKNCALRSIERIDCGRIEPEIDHYIKSYNKRIKDFCKKYNAIEKLRSKISAPVSDD
jgi:hypothetical protein